MPFSVEIENLPLGYVASSGREGETIELIIREFTSSEDGEIFISRLEGLPSALIRKISNPHPFISQIDNFLAVIKPDKTVDIYINELMMRETTRIKKGTNAGSLVFEDDIADIIQIELCLPGVQADETYVPGTPIDITKLKLTPIKIPSDAGIIFIFSDNWRKGMYIDLAPLHEEFGDRKDNLWQIFGSYKSYLSFQHLFKLTPSQWENLIEQRWFLFTSLKKSTLKEITNYLNNNWEIDELTEKIAVEVADMLDSMIERWSKHDLFEPHMKFFEHAVDKYREEDYLSANAILYPKIEGLLRTNHFVNSTDKPTQSDLVNSLVDARQEEYHPYSLLLPEVFRTYLTEFYFAHFEPSAVSAPLSRNTVGHGVADVEEFSIKQATIALLILDQIFYFMPSSKKNED